MILAIILIILLCGALKLDYELKIKEIEHQRDMYKESYEGYTRLYKTYKSDLKKLELEYTKVYDKMVELQIENTKLKENNEDNL